MNENKFYTVSVTVAVGQPAVTFDIESTNPLNANSPENKTGTFTLTPTKDAGASGTWYFDPDSNGKFAGTLTFQDPRYINSPLKFGTDNSGSGSLTGGAYTVTYTEITIETNNPTAKTIETNDPPAFGAKVP